MNSHRPAVIEIVRNDPRYTYEAYEFMFEALSHAQKLHGRVPEEGEDEFTAEHHISGPELLHGACDLARDEFGLLARTVFRHWGINRTDDIGEIVFNLIEAELLCRTESDHRSDFQGLFDLDAALTDDFAIELSETTWTKRSPR